MKTPKFSVSPKDKELGASILKKIEKENKNGEAKIIDFDSFFKLLNKDEKILVERFRDINPKIYGFKGPYLGIQGVPKNLVAISNQKYKLKNKIKKIETQYLPKPVFAAYKKLNDAIYKDIGKKLLVESGYRSPAYQIVTFFYFFYFYKFNFLKTIKRVAIPGYSEHGFPKGQAVDFFTTEGVPSDERPLDFAKTIEYKWLLKNANKFGFYLSYPRNNKLGMMFEPWHWQFRK